MKVQNLYFVYTNFVFFLSKSRCAIEIMMTYFLNIIHFHPLWITSYENMRAYNWPPAKAIPQDPYAEEWDTLSRFEKLCWAWTRLNEYALGTLSTNPNVRVFRFEKIFSNAGRYQTLNDLISFTTSQPGIDPTRIGNTAGWLERRSHQSSQGFPTWDNWTKDQRQQFEQHCGALMNKLGYEI
jgi:hypothetical protein